jgi:hypothetical protein
MRTDEENDGRICDKHEYARHIGFSCKNHPNKRWSTKNIAPLGCRSIFYNLHADKGMGPECACAMSDLVHVCEDAG